MNATAQLDWASQALVRSGLLDGTRAVPLTLLVLACALGAVVALAAAPATVRLAARRTVAQPLSQHPVAEADVIATVLEHPEWFCVVSPLEASWFADPDHAEVWAALCDRLGADDVRAEIAARGLTEVDELPEQPELAEISAVGCSDASGLAEELAGSVGVGAVAVLDVPGSVLAGPGELRCAAELIAVAADDRIRLGGVGTVVVREDGEGPLERSYAAPGRRRIVWCALALSTVCGLVPLFAANAYPDAIAAWALATLALWALAATSAVVGLVDLDTFYLDTPGFAVGASLSWALTAAAAVATGDPGRLLVGVLLVLAIGAFLEISNRVYRATRGVDGMGFGDTIIVVATSGVPAAISGSAQLGFHALIAGMVASIVAHLVSMRRAGADSQTPFAFGPYLAVGWPIAWLVHLVASQLVGG